jgi:hypothetical protein
MCCPSSAAARLHTVDCWISFRSSVSHFFLITENALKFGLGIMAYGAASPSADATQMSPANERFLSVEVSET